MFTCTASEAQQKLLMVIFPGVGAFEQLFGPVRGEFEQEFSKNSTFSLTFLYAHRLEPYPD